MALATHQLTGSCSTFPFMPSSWSRGSKLKHSVPKFHAIGGKNRFVSLKCRSCSSIGASLVHGPKSKLFKISAFKGSRQYGDSSSRSNSSKCQKNTVKVSYVQNKSEESSVESSKVQNVLPTPYTAADETIVRSLSIQNSFKNWLMLVHVPSRTQPVEEVLEEPSSFRNISTPLYLAVNLVYGLKISKELTPLWILGPLIVALYIKMFRAICGLYAFSFKQIIKVVKNLPVFCLLVHDYIVHGKLKEAM